MVEICYVLRLLDPLLSFSIWYRNRTLDQVEAARQNMATFFVLWRCVIVQTVLWQTKMIMMMTGRLMKWIVHRMDCNIRPKQCIIRSSRRHLSLPILKILVTMTSPLGAIFLTHGGCIAAFALHGGIYTHFKHWNCQGTREQ